MRKPAVRLYAVYSSNGWFLGAYKYKAEALDFAKMDGGHGGEGIVITYVPKMVTR